MRFYDRERELGELERIKKIAFNEFSRLTVVTGRRRIGKTSLLLKSVEGEKTAYFFVSRKNEALLCRDFVEELEFSLGIKVPGQYADFRSLFFFIMDLSTRLSFNLIIDEFQDFQYVNPSIFGDIQHYWDRFRRAGHVNLLISGSVTTMMERIFRDKKEPLFGRADALIRLEAFPVSTMKQILQDYAPTHTADDLLALYSFTGGVPKYIEQFVDAQALDVQAMIAFMTKEDSLFIDEGRTHLIEEFGKEYGNYFSILALISSGQTERNKLNSMMQMEIGGYLGKLENDYHLIARRRPILSKEGSRNVRYCICDKFLNFWFRYFYNFRLLIESKNFKALQERIRQDYPTFSGIMLEDYFKEKMMEEGRFAQIGSWWNASKGDCEIDIVALYLEKKHAFVAEVKRQKKNFKPEIFQQKVDYLRHSLLHGYTIDAACLSLEDM